MEHTTPHPTTPVEEIEPRGALSLERYFTTPGEHPFETVEWELRDAHIGHGERVAFEQANVEFPRSWSQNATNIVAQKYFRGQLGHPARERSVKQMIGRVAGTIATWGRERGYFASDEDGDAFEAELTYILLHQMAAFNSPVWFNVGIRGDPAVLGVLHPSVEDDTMESILAWNTKEGMIFRGGSGSGINLSNIRGSMEPLAKGGTASGPVSFMRGADSWAGTIKSGGKTRRAAKMVVLDVDHPDIKEFIWCKAKEEDKAQALRDAGFDMSIDGEGFKSIQYQNANNSVRVSDEFMRAVEQDGEWRLTARTTGEPVGEPLSARELMREIAQAAWRCADPGVQYDTTINRWHTCPNSGRINASNPCSEYMHVDDSACNLASLNLMKFRRADGTLDVQSFEHAVDVMLLAQEIVVGPSSYPTEEIARNARAFRQLGLGYANLGAYLMSNGMPYDSDAGRETAAAITALMTGRAYRRSAEVAAALGPYERYAENREAHNGVMRMHRDACHVIPDEGSEDPGLLAAARRSWDEAVELGERHGYRNAQATVLAPTGTISFLMDCDTTGIEPDFSLVKYKELVGGGQMTIVNRTVPLALQTLGYSEHADRADRGPPGRARHDRRRAGTHRRAPARVRRGRRRARDLAHGPPEDDGRRAAVHLRERSPRPSTCPRSPPSRTSPTPTRRPGAWASRRSRSTATGRRPRRRCAPRPRTPRRRTQASAREDVDAIVEAAVTSALAEVGSASASACRASASRSRTSSRSAGTRATSPPACTRTAASGRSS